MEKEIIKKEYWKEIIPVYGIYESMRRQIKQEPSLTKNWGIFLGSYQGVVSGSLITQGLENLIQFLQ